MTVTMTQVENDYITRDAGPYALKTLEAAYRRTANWFALCDYYQADPANRLEPKLSSMPSKNHKHQMYATASQLLALIGTVTVTGATTPLPRPSTMDEIAAVIRLGKATFPRPYRAA
jgi:hypothetical protein